MRTNDDGHAERGVSALAERAYERAGDAFTRAAWRVLAEPRPGRSPFDDDDRGWVGDGLRWLVTAGVAYRVAGRDARATRRGVEGVAISRDLRTALAGAAQPACLEEIAADCRIVGGLDDVGHGRGLVGVLIQPVEDRVDGDSGKFVEEVDPDEGGERVRRTRLPVLRRHRQIPLVEAGDQLEGRYLGVDETGDASVERGLDVVKVGEVVVRHAIGWSWRSLLGRWVLFPRFRVRLFTRT
jgi:hypothetical protein